ncbi:hypothetical protein VUR80DRAFT_1049 [Thermomyces stellatus]
MKDGYVTSEGSSNEHFANTTIMTVQAPEEPSVRGTVPSGVLRRPWYMDREYLLGGWADPPLRYSFFAVSGRQVLEAFGTAFYVYVSGSISTTLMNYGITQTGGYVGFGNIALLSLFIYATGSATGGHLNPLVSFSAIISGVLPVSRGILYLLGQALGGAVAGGVLAGVYGRDRAIRVEGGGCYFDESLVTPGQVFLNECFSSLAYLYISYGVGIDPSQGLLFGPRLAPLLAGGCLGLVTFATSGIIPGYAGAQMNPARCFGFGIARRDMSDQWIWWFAPAAAALLLAFVFNFAPLHADDGEAVARRPGRPQSGRDDAA